MGEVASRKAVNMFQELRDEYGHQLAIAVTGSNYRPTQFSDYHMEESNTLPQVPVEVMSEHVVAVPQTPSLSIDEVQKKVMRITDLTADATAIPMDSAFMDAGID